MHTDGFKYITLDGLLAMAEDNCPRCGHDNSDQIGCIPLGSGSGRIDHSKRQCSDCGHSYEVGT